MDVAFDSLGERDLIDEAKSFGSHQMNRSAMLTDRGREMAAARIERRKDARARRGVCRDAVLRWAYEREANGEASEIAEIASSPYGWFNGVLFSAADLMEALRFLRERRLLDGTDETPTIEPAGVECVEQYGGVVAYLNRGDGGGVNVTIMGNNSGQLAVANRDVTQNRTKYTIVGKPEHGYAVREVYPGAGAATTIAGGVMLRAGAIIYAGASIGEDTTIGHHTLLRSHVTVGSGSQLAHNLTVGRGSQIGEGGVRCSPASHITADTFVGDRVFLGAGVRTDTNGGIAVTETRATGQWPTPFAAMLPQLRLEDWTWLREFEADLTTMAATEPTPRRAVRPRRVAAGSTSPARSPPPTGQPR